MTSDHPCARLPQHPTRRPRRTVRRWPGPLARWQVRLYIRRNRVRKRLGLPTIWPPPYLRQDTP